MSNVLFVNGWGGALTSGSLARLCYRTRAEFGTAIYAPPPVDYTNESMIIRYLDKWVDVQLLVMLSCGCSAGAKIAALKPSERIPAAFFYSPSRLCGMLGFPIPKNIELAVQVTSNTFDGFNLGAAQLVKPKSGNNVTKFETIYSGYPHGWSPDSPIAQRRLWEEIQKSLRK